MPLPELPDEALLAGFGTGDPAAAVAFVRRFQDRVYGLAATVVGHGPEAADVAQEAFERAWQRADAYDARRGSVVTWLLAITRNRAIDHVRMQRARPMTSDDVSALVSIASTDPGPDDRAVVGDDVRRVVTALRALPDEQRRAVVLASIAGRTAQQVADDEGVPLGTAKTRIRTGLIRLRTALHDDAVVDSD